MSARCVLKHGGTETQSLFEPYLYLLHRLSVPSVALCFQLSARFFLKHGDAETQRVERQSEDCFVKIVGSYLADPLTRKESDGISPGIVA